MKTLQVVPDFPYPGLVTELRESTAHSAGRTVGAWIFSARGHRRELLRVFEGSTAREAVTLARRTPRFALQ